MSRDAVARGVSIVGHPLVLLPISAIALAHSQGASLQLLATIGVFSGVGFALLFWARHNVRTRRWEHVDASQPTERKQWDLVVLACLAVLTAISWFYARPLLPGPVSAAGIILLSLASSPWLKLSQHVAFAVLSAAIVSVASSIACIVFVVLALAVGWSRLVLARHSLVETIAGAAAGLASGLLFITLLADLP